MEWLARGEHWVSVLDLASMAAGDNWGEATVRRALEIEALAESWREDLKARVAR